MVPLDSAEGALSSARWEAASNLKSQGHQTLVRPDGSCVSLSDRSRRVFGQKVQELTTASSSLTWRVDASHCLQQSEAFRALATANLLAMFYDSFALPQKSVMRSRVWSSVDLATRSLHCYYRLLSSASLALPLSASSMVHSEAETLQPVAVPVRLRPH